MNDRSRLIDPRIAGAAIEGRHAKLVGLLAECAVLSAEIALDLSTAERPDAAETVAMIGVTLATLSQQVNAVPPAVPGYIERGAAS